MALMSVFETNVTPEPPSDAQGGTPRTQRVSDFITSQSFANFAAMTGGITAAWHGLQMVLPGATTLWVPYGIAFGWGIISFLISLEGLSMEPKKGLPRLGTYMGAFFIALLNSLVLAGAVVGTTVVVTSRAP